MNGHWKGYDFHFQTTHLTYTQCINEDWVTVTLFSNYAFDVHTVYQWGLSDRYHYFQTTHLTYTQLVYQWGLNDRYHYFQTTHLTYTQLVYQWGLISLFSNYAFDVHTVYQWELNRLLSLFSYYAFDVHAVYQWGLDRLLSTDGCFVFFAVPVFAFTIIFYFCTFSFFHTQGVSWWPKTLWCLFFTPGVYEKNSSPRGMPRTFLSSWLSKNG